MTVDRKIANSLKNLAEIGSGQYISFISDCLLNYSRPIDDPIPRNCLAPFVSLPSMPRKTLSYLLLRMIVLSFPTCTIGGQVGDHKNQAFPPSLIDNELLCFGIKASLPQCVEENQIVH